MAQIDVLVAKMPERFRHVLGSEAVIDELPEAVDERKFYFVTDELFEKILQTRYKNAVRCTQQEVDTINATFGNTNLTVNDFFFEKDVKCNCCNKQITFYDVFCQATKKHGTEFLRWAILSEEKKIQTFPKFFKHEIECSQCHSIITADEYTHYGGSGYACA